ncbi:MAG: LptF/LptG family permease [Puniceicoccales bacterium]|jgi:lipopolysaccharide export system permease protein|nr:LptF/LptG family permease [Puniceicoccales bacterium]
MLYRRHIFWRTLRATLACVALFVGALLAGNGLRDAVPLLAAGQLAPRLFFQTLSALVPSVAAYALPLGLLTAVLLTVGRMAADRELLILRSTGLGPGRVAVPILWLALLAAAGSLAIDLFHAPRALYSYRQGLRRLVQRDPLRFLCPGQFVRHFPGLILHAAGQDGTSLRGLHIWELRGGGAVAGCLRADLGRLSLAEDGDSLVLTLENGSLERMDGGAMVFFREFSLPLALAHGLPAVEGQKRLKHRDLFELCDAFVHWTGGQEPLESRCRERRRLDFIAVNLVLQRSLAMACSLIAFALLAIPLAERLARSETSLALALALLLALAYYFALTAISWLEASPTLRADWLIWLPNGILFAAAGWLWWRGRWCQIS